jgi:hypothetical protein
MPEFALSQGEFLGEERYLTTKSLDEQTLKTRRNQPKKTPDKSGVFYYLYQN